VQAQRITHIIEAQGVRELGVEQADHMTPRTKRARPSVHPGVSRQLWHKVIGNQVAELPQERKAAARWLADRLFFHPRPCGRVQTRKPTLFYHPKTSNLWSANDHASFVLEIARHLPSNA